jgi:cell division septation protein DedD
VTFFRAGFLFLVFANLVFFAWAKGYFGARETGREPHRLNEQIAADKLRIVAAPPATAKLACRLVAGLPADEAEGFRAMLSGYGLAVEVRPEETSTSFLVFIPPQPNKATAEKKAAEVRKLGVKEFALLLDDNPDRFAVSFGLFKSEAAANALLKDLTKRGVRSARVEPREKSSSLRRATVKGPVELVDKRLPEVLAKLPDASASDCP